MFWFTVFLYAGLAATGYIQTTGKETHDFVWWAGLIGAVLFAVKLKLSPNAGQSESEATKKQGDQP